MDYYEYMTRLLNGEKSIMLLAELEFDMAVLKGKRERAKKRRLTNEAIEKGKRT